MRLKKAIAVIMAASTATTMSITAFAESVPENNYAVVTNEDGSDPVWVELTDENAESTDGNIEVKEEAIEEGKVVQEIEEFEPEESLLKVTDVVDDVSELEKGETYSFVEGDNVTEGSYISGVPEGGAILTYLGEGKDEIVTDAYSSTPYTVNPVNILQNAIYNVDEYISDNEYLGLMNQYANGDISDDDLQIMLIKNEFQSEFEWFGISTSSLKTLEDWENAYVKLLYYEDLYDEGEEYDEESFNNYVQNNGPDIIAYFKESSAEEFQDFVEEAGMYSILKIALDGTKTDAEIKDILLKMEVEMGCKEAGIPTIQCNTFDEYVDASLRLEYMLEICEGNFVESDCLEFIAENRDDLINGLDETIARFKMYGKEYLQYYSADDVSYFKNYVEDMRELLPIDINNPTDAELQAILDFYGLTQEELNYMCTNKCSSNMIPQKNAGFVRVVKPGTGFDDCYEGMIVYYDGDGWMYGCTGGGVDFGEARGLHLYDVTEEFVPVNAYTVIPRNAIKLNKNGDGYVKLEDVKAQVEIDGVMYDIDAFEFLEDYVYIHEGQTDVHATVLIAGRPYTLTFDLLKWNEEPEKPVPIDLKPAEEKVPEVVEEKPVVTNSSSEHQVVASAVETTLPVGNYVTTSAGVAPFMTGDAGTAGWTSLTAAVTANAGGTLAVTMNGTATVDQQVMATAAASNTKLSLTLDNSVNVDVNPSVMSQIMALPTVDAAGNPILDAAGNPVNPFLQLSAVTWNQAAGSPVGTCGFSNEDLQSIGADLNTPVVKVMTSNTDRSQLITITFDAAKAGFQHGDLAYLYGGATGQIGYGGNTVIVDENGMATFVVPAVNGFWTIGTLPTPVAPAPVPAVPVAPVEASDVEVPVIEPEKEEDEIM